MLITLSKKWQDFLASKPESGMGYQVVDLVFNDGTKETGVIVLNGEVCEINPEHKGKEISDIIVRH